MAETVVAPVFLEATTYEISLLETLIASDPCWANKVRSCSFNPFFFKQLSLAVLPKICQNQSPILILPLIIAIVAGIPP